MTRKEYAARRKQQEGLLKDHVKRVNELFKLAREDRRNVLSLAPKKIHTEDDLLDTIDALRTEADEMERLHRALKYHMDMARGHAKLLEKIEQEEAAAFPPRWSPEEAA